MCLAKGTNEERMLIRYPPGCGYNRNEALHKTLCKNISRQRLGIQLALALLTIGFLIWNEKKGQVREENGLSSIQS